MPIALIFAGALLGGIFAQYGGNPCLPSRTYFLAPPKVIPAPSPDETREERRRRIQELLDRAEKGLRLPPPHDPYRETAPVIQCA